MENLGPPSGGGDDCKQSVRVQIYGNQNAKVKFFNIFFQKKMPCD